MTRCQKCNCDLSGGTDTFGLSRESFCQSCWYEWGDEIKERERFNQEMTQSFWEEINAEQGDSNANNLEISHSHPR